MIAKWANAPYGTEPPSWIKVKNPTYSQPIGRRERFEGMRMRRARAVGTPECPAGRAGFVMANSAGDARGSELEIRRQLLQANAVDVMISVGPNFFYTVTLPCTLWFLDRGKKKTGRKDKVLFIDARHIFNQVDRAHREWTPDQVEFISNIVRLYRGEEAETEAGSMALMKPNFPNGRYVDVAGVCNVATLQQIEAQGWSLNPGRYVRVAERAADDFEFAERLEGLNEGLETLNIEARGLEERIAENVQNLLETVA